MNKIKPPLYLSLTQAAQYAGVNRFTMMTAIATQKVKAFHRDNGNRSVWSIDFDSLKKWISKRNAT